MEWTDGGRLVGDRTWSLLELLVQTRCSGWIGYQSFCCLTPTVSTTVRSDILNFKVKICQWTLPRWLDCSSPLNLLNRSSPYKGRTFVLWVEAPGGHITCLSLCSSTTQSERLQGPCAALVVQTVVVSFTLLNHILSASAAKLEAELWGEELRGGLWKTRDGEQRQRVCARWTLNCCRARSSCATDIRASHASSWQVNSIMLFYIKNKDFIKLESSQKGLSKTLNLLACTADLCEPSPSPVFNQRQN